jgi:cytosine deaminase
MRLPPHAIAPGNDANLVVLEGASLREALTWHAEPRWYIRNGRVLTESSTLRREYKPGETP